MSRSSSGSSSECCSSSLSLTYMMWPRRTARAGEGTSRPAAAWQHTPDTGGARWGGRRQLQPERRMQDRAQEILDPEILDQEI